MSLGTRLKTRQQQVFRLGQVVDLLQMSAAELGELVAETARENPMLMLPDMTPARGGATDMAEMAAVPAAGSLYEHVTDALSGLIAQGGLMERVIVGLVSELEPSGWLGRDPAEIAQTLDVSAEIVETALRVVQKRIDPAGLFARNLQECLRLQLEDREAMTGALDCVLSMLPVLERDGVAGLVVATGLDEDEIRDCLAVIRRLDPKPGSAFGTDLTLTRAPDVRIVPDGEGWDIEFLTCFSEVRVASLPRGQRTSETGEAMVQARALKRALEVRRSAMRQVVPLVVNRQSAFFRSGFGALTPMTMSEIAAETGFSTGTVSRVLNGLLIEGPNGITLARALFSRTVSSGASHCKPSVQARLRVLLSGEDPARPISDRRLAEMLQGEGVAVSRRVVSNYRQEIGILPAAQRRLRA